MLGFTQLFMSTYETDTNSVFVRLKQLNITLIGDHLIFKYKGLVILLSQLFMPTLLNTLWRTLLWRIVSECRRLFLITSETYTYQHPHRSFSGLLLHNHITTEKLYNVEAFSRLLLFHCISQKKMCPKSHEIIHTRILRTLFLISYRNSDLK